jgi:hypothetical protein
MSESQRIRQQQVPQSQNMFRTAQASTQNTTDSYLWLDENGKILWSSSFANATLHEQLASADRGDRAYFAVPKETLIPHTTSVINSVDNNPRFYVSYPVLADYPQENFRGAVVASVQPISIGRFLQSKISPQFQSTMGLLDKEGVILYSPGESQIGMNVFGDEYQSVLPVSLRP